MNAYPPIVVTAETQAGIEKTDQDEREFRKAMAEAFRHQPAAMNSPFHDHAQEVADEENKFWTTVDELSKKDARPFRNELTGKPAPLTDKQRRTRKAA